MGHIYTGKLQIEIPDWAEPPDVPQAMLTALGEMEAYSILPVDDATDRDTRIPTLERWIGMTTYNTATDTFEYWNGTKWLAVNAEAAMPASQGAGANVAIALAAGKFYDYGTVITLTKRAMVRIHGDVNLMAHCTSTQWQGATILTSFDGTLASTAGPQWIVGYPNQAANLWGQLTVEGRYTANPGEHRFGFRVTALNGSGDLTIQRLGIQLTRLSATAYSGGSNAHGDW